MSTAVKTATSLGGAMNQILNNLFVKCGTCPVCGGPLYKPKAKYKNGSEIDVSACPNAGCGWKSPIRGAKTDVQRRQEWTIEAKKNTTMDYFKTNSIVENKEQFSKDFINFRTDDEQRQKLKGNALKLVQEFVNNTPTHSVLTGGAGRGKSHLAMAMAYEYLRETNYAKTATFINWPALLSLSKKTMGENVDDLRVYVNGLTNEFDKSDLLVIDDLGAESATNKPTEYSVNMATAIFSSRSEKNLIVTTNLTAPEIRTAYGNRLVSRMLNHLNLGGMNFAGLDDFRMKGI